MKKLINFVLIAAIFFTVSCGSDSKKEEKKLIETKSAVITVEKGGEIESSDGSAAVQIPAGALDKDTEITMKVYKSNGFKDKDAIASNVVEFGPDGTVFKKPIIISIKAEKSVKNELISAAVLKKDGSWSFSREGKAVMIAGKDEQGDPIMTTAQGDPIMVNAQGDPIMTNAQGDPIMLSAQGDPIMISAQGDPIMNASQGDPIMMTSGHFSSYAFVIVDKINEDKDKERPSGKITCKTEKEWATEYGEEWTEEDEKDQLTCENTGELMEICIEGDIYSETNGIYSIRAGKEEFLCEKDNNTECVMNALSYCGNIDGDYGEDGYCENDGVCASTGEKIQLCVNPSDSKYATAYVVGDKKFECTGSGCDKVYEEMVEYCGQVLYGEMTCKTETEWANEYSDESHKEWICEASDSEIKICIDDDFDPENDKFPTIELILAGSEVFYCTNDDSEDYSDIGDYVTTRDCYSAVLDYCGSNGDDFYVPEGCEEEFFCDAANEIIYRCERENGDAYLMIGGNEQECAEPEDGEQKCFVELDEFYESCNQ